MEEQPDGTVHFEEATGKYEVDDLKNGDLVKVNCVNGKEMIGMVVDQRPSYKHSKVIIVSKSDDYYICWGKHRTKALIVSVTDRIANLADGLDYIGDDLARQLTEKYFAKEKDEIDW